MSARLAIVIIVLAVVSIVSLFVGLRHFAGSDKRTKELIAEIERSPWWSGTPTPGAIREVAEHIQRGPAGTVYLIDRKCRLTIAPAGGAENSRRRSSMAVIDTEEIPKSTFIAVLALMDREVRECLLNFGPARDAKDDPVNRQRVRN